MAVSGRSDKGFLQVVKQIQKIIDEEQIQIGEKLPSERKLAEKLEVGRSSVREALRSLELLGLIETRRGEGTFLADFKKHQLVEVLATFIMQQSKSYEDVIATRRMHERTAVEYICAHPHCRLLPVWESLYYKLQEEGTILREDVFREMIIATENRLALKIWFLLKQYSRVPFSQMTTEEEQEYVKALLVNLALGKRKEAVEAYEQWIDTIEEGGGRTNDS